MDTPKYTTKKLAIIGVTAGLVAGAGAGLLMNLPGGASAKSPVAVSATGTESDTATDAPASSIGGEAGEVEENITAAVTATDTADVTETRPSAKPSFVRCCRGSWTMARSTLPKSTPS